MTGFYIVGVDGLPLASRFGEFTKYKPTPRLMRGSLVLFLFPFSKRACFGL
jgi:hypothetical protein